MSIDLKPQKRGVSKGSLAVGALAGALLMAGCVPEEPPTTGGTTTTAAPTTTIPEPQANTIWGYTKESFDTNVRNGYQLALDQANRKVYYADTAWSTQTRTGVGGETTFNVGSGKLVEFDTETREFVKNHSFLNLTRNDGNGTEGEQFDWTGITSNSVNSMRTHFSPYGVAVDGTTTYGGVQDATIITTTARQQGTADGYNYGGGLVVYRASQGAPTDADRIWKFEDGSPVLLGPRRVAVNTETHKAYVTNLGNASIPGFIAVIDLQTKNVDARVTIPAEAAEGGHAYPGAVGVTVDEDTNTVYVGSINGTSLFSIDAGAINTSNAQDLALNNATVTELANVGGNARPTYSHELKKVYVSSYPTRGGSGWIKVVEGDKASANYGQVIDEIAIEGAAAEDGITTNSVEIDGERNLLYSANLGAREVVVYNATTLEQLLVLPTSGNAINMGIDPVTRDLWVSNFSNNGKADVFTVQELVERTTSDGAKFYLPTSVFEGRPIPIVGSGWKTIGGVEGSVVAVKYNQGATSPNPDLGHPGDGVWGVANADAAGNWSLQTPFPSAGNADGPFAAGNSYLIHLLTGSLGNNDVVRAPATPVQVLSAS